jgi:hypothetical protein
VRDHILTLACLRLGRPAAYAKGADQLPAQITGPLQATLVRSLDTDELSRALQSVTRALIDELRATDPETARTLADLLLNIAARPDPSHTDPPNQGDSRR